MKPLREEVDFPDEQVALAARLVSQVMPLAASDLRAARARRFIERRASGGYRSQKRTALLVAFILGAVVSAGATYGVLEWNEAEDVSPPVSHIESPQKAFVPGASPGKTYGIAPPGVVPTDVAEEDPASTNPWPPTESTPKHSPEGASESRGAIPRPQKNNVVATTAEKQSGTGKGEHGAVKSERSAEKSEPRASEAQLVQQAVKALRNSGDAERAEQLLQEYRLKTTSGQLDEEALALSIEVALAQGDPSAANHARSYLARYPQGRFQELARRALAR